MWSSHKVCLCPGIWKIVCFHLPRLGRYVRMNQYTSSIALDNPAEALIESIGYKAPLMFIA